MEKKTQNSDIIKILIFGDIVGRIGRKSLTKEIPNLKYKYNPDFIIANGENLASGRGPTEELILKMGALGIDLFTGGNHSFDNEKKIINYMDKPESILIRPANHIKSRFYKIPGKGYKIIEKNGKNLLVINLMSGVFMRDQMDNVFLKLDEIIEKIKGEKIDSIIVDFHRETSAELYAMAYFSEKLNKQISVIYGTHTHIQTNDEIIFPSGTGIISDIGMTGSLYSVIGSEYKSLEKRFLTGIGKGKIEQDLGNDYLVNYLFVEIDKNTGKTIKIKKDRIRGTL